MRFLSSTRIVRVVLALAVAFWMAGAGCMLGCENMVTAAASSETTSAASAPTIIATGEACASMHSHDCCASHRAKRAQSSGAQSKTTISATAVITELGATSSSMMDCPLAVNATAALAKAKQDQSSNALLLTRVSGSIPDLHEQATALSPPLRLPNRGQTYLRCCVFLI
jgi:hypothetical protein